jgi:hypothetical protein
MARPMTVTCTKCKKERPASEKPCPHCGASPHPHRRTAEEHADYLRAVAERVREVPKKRKGSRRALARLSRRLVTLCSTPFLLARDGGGNRTWRGGLGSRCWWQTTMP